MGVETEIRGEIDYSGSDYPDIIEKLLDILPTIGWGSSASRYYPESKESTLVEMYNGENEYFHRLWWFSIDKKKKIIHIEGVIKNYQQQYERTLAIIARYLSEACTSKGTYQYEEWDNPEEWTIKNNKLFWGSRKAYVLGSLDFLRIPLPHPEEWSWEEKKE